MTINADALSATLRKKFRTPGAVLARLGLDAKLLRDTEVLEESSDPDRHFTGRYVRFEDQPSEVRGRVADDEEDEPRAKPWSVDELKREHLRALGFDDGEIDRLYELILGKRGSMRRSGMGEGMIARF